MTGGLEPKDVSAILSAWGEGNQEAGNELIGIVYQELRRLAAYYLQSERGDHTLQPTALVHEAYLRLVDQTQVQCRNRALQGLPPIVPEPSQTAETMPLFA